MKGLFLGLRKNTKKLKQAWHILNSVDVHRIRNQVMLLRFAFPNKTPYTSERRQLSHRHRLMFCPSSAFSSFQKMHNEKGNGKREYVCMCVPMCAVMCLQMCWREKQRLREEKKGEQNEEHEREN